jgi:membrane protease YdiL (CAAX protease family)
MVRDGVPSPIPFLPDETEEVLRPKKLAVYLTVAVLGVIGYWYLGTPGPQLEADHVRNFDAGLAGVGWSVGFYLVVPAVVMLLARDSLGEAGLRIGDAKYGLKTTLVVCAIVVPAMFFTAKDPIVQGTYPWAGGWPGESASNLLTWAGLYFFFFLSFEFFFRGFLIRAIRPHWGVGAALWVQAIAATAAHLGKPPAETAAALLASLLLGLMAVRGRSILWPALLHFLVGMSVDALALHHQGQLLP